jgi:hypothetical protein
MIVFETRKHGTLPVTNMIDIDGEETGDIGLAEQVVCPLPDGSWMVSCACANCGKLKEIKDREVH